MNKRELMQALIAGERLKETPQWLMSFADHSLMEKLIPERMHYDGYNGYPSEGSYPFTAMNEELLEKEQVFNEYIDRCAFPVGWGANAAFGHSGPGEFNKRVIEKSNDGLTVEYETGAKKAIRFFPHSQHTFYLPIKKREDVENLELPDPEASERYKGFAEDAAWAKEHGEWTVGWINGFFSSVHYFFREYQSFLMDVVLEPDFSKAMIEKIGNWNLTAARMMCEAGIDCIGFCDDMGSSQSMLINPELYCELIYPWHKKLCDVVHSYGAVVHMHSHGNIIPILKNIAEAGIDILNPLDPDDKMPMEQVREAIGPKVVLCGGMNKHFFDWSKDDQVGHLKEVVSKGRKFGPHILMDSGGIPENVEQSWFRWFLEASKDIRLV